MNWQISFKGKVEKKLEKLDKSARRQIIKYFDKITESNENPKSFGRPLLENKKGLWRYRVGDYRIICDIHDNELIILVIDIGHRSEIYK